MSEALKGRKGKGNAVTNADIVRALRQWGFTVDAPRCRKLINHIRTQDIIPGLIATSRGYFIAESEAEIKEYEESLAGRENAIRQVRTALARQRRALFGNTAQPQPLSLF